MFSKSPNIYSGQYIPDFYLHTDEPPLDYFDAPPLPASATTVTRYVRDPRPYVAVCSTYDPYVPVTLPRISMIDGQYRRAANDNSLDARHQEAARVAA